MIRRLAVTALLCTALALLGGCSKTHRIQIESDTCWAGFVNNDLSIADCGNATYKIVGLLQCVRVQKTTSTGYLRVRIDSRPWADATGTLGQVQVCE
jgi:hypothetical protein